MYFGGIKEPGGITCRGTYRLYAEAACIYKKESKQQRGSHYDAADLVNMFAGRHLVSPYHRVAVLRNYPI